MNMFEEFKKLDLGSIPSGHVLVLSPETIKAHKGIILNQMTEAEEEEMIARGKACADQYKGTNETNRKVLAMRARHILPGRNDPCSCGSGKKFKKCHGGGF